MIHFLFNFIIFTLRYSLVLIRQNLLLMFGIVKKKLDFQDHIITYTTENLGEYELFIFTNLITLTPSTICIESKPEKQELIIHAMFIKEGADGVEEWKKAMKEDLELPLLKVLR